MIWAGWCCSRHNHQQFFRIFHLLQTLFDFSRASSLFLILEKWVLTLFGFLRFEFPDFVDIILGVQYPSYFCSIKLVGCISSKYWYSISQELLIVLYCLSTFRNAVTVFLFKFIQCQYSWIWIRICFLAFQNSCQALKAKVPRGKAIYTILVQSWLLPNFENLLNPFLYFPRHYLEYFYCLNFVFFQRSVRACVQSCGPVAKLHSRNNDFNLRKVKN